jgi:hypothetical protein
VLLPGKTSNEYGCQRRSASFVFIAFFVEVTTFFKQFQCIQSPLTLQEKLKKKEKRKRLNLRRVLISPFDVLKYRLRIK